MKEKKRNKKWIKTRHSIVKAIVFALLYPYSKIKYGLRLEKLKEGGDRQYLVLYNHQTAFDQFFVGMAFKKHLYYVASEDLFSNGFLSKVISFLVAPIPIKKQTADMRAIMNCIKVSKEGGSIAIAPEGNRTYSGKTEYMSPSIAPLARKLGLPIAIFKIEGGYGTHPRWSDVVRKGETHCYVSRIIEPCEYENMTDGELFDLISGELYVNEANADSVYKHKRRAEYLERAIYVCPKCGLSKFESSGDRLTCKSCGLSVTYTERKELVCEQDGFNFKFVNDWYEWQNKYISDLELDTLSDEALFTDDGAALKKELVYKKKEIIYDKCRIELYKDRVRVISGENERVFPFDEVTAVVVLGKNKLNLYHDKNIYQIKGTERFNALKYVHFYYKYKNVKKGDPNGEFLGL